MYPLLTAEPLCGSVAPPSSGAIDVDSPLETEGQHARIEVAASNLMTPDNCDEELDRTLNEMAGFLPQFSSSEPHAAETNRLISFAI